MSDSVRSPLVVLRSEAFTRMRWANGAGATAQVAASPAGSGLDDFDWRVSLAEIEVSGEFSTFSGVDRILMLVEGRGMDLEIDGNIVAALPLSPVSFAGESAARCRLVGGPTKDLNVMTRRGRVEASLDLFDLAQGVDLVPSSGSVVIGLIVEGGAAVLGASHDVLVTLDAVLVDRPLSLVGHGTVARITLHDLASAQDS